MVGNFNLLNVLCSSTACFSYLPNTSFFRFFKFLFGMLRVLVVFGLNATLICSLIIIIIIIIINVSLAVCWIQKKLNDHRCNLRASKAQWMQENRFPSAVLLLCAALTIIWAAWYPVCPSVRWPYFSSFEMKMLQHFHTNFTTSQDTLQTLVQPYS